MTTGIASLGLLGGDGWVVEHIAEDKTRTIYPLVGWLVTADFQVHPLPSLDSSWVVRPRTANDEQMIAASAKRLRPSNSNQNWSYQ